MLKIACPTWPRMLRMDLQVGLWEMMENPIFYFQVTDTDSH